MKYWWGAAGLVVAVLAAWLVMRGDGGPEERSVVATAARGRGNAPISVTRQPGRRIAGTVERDGAPFAGAAVHVASAYGEETRVSDASGGFDFGPQPARTYVVFAEVPQLTGAVLEVDLRRVDVPSEQLRLVLHACDTSIVGTVRDVAGGVIPNARVAHSIDGELTDLSAASGADGGYALCVPPGNGWVDVSADGYATRNVPIAAFGRSRYDVELPPETVIHGRVEPAIAGAVVRVTTPMQFRSDSHAATDADGRFQIAGQLPGKHEVTATADGLATQRSIEFVTKVGDNPEIVVPLSPAFSVEGKVVEEGTHNGVAGVALRMSDRGVVRDDVTDVDGAFAFASVPRGEYKVFGDGHHFRDIDVQSNMRGVMLAITGRVAIAGRVTRNHHPVDGAMVSCGGASVGAGADGRYAISCEEGSRELYAESQRLGAFSKRTIEVREPRSDVDIELDLVASIAGTVVDQAGVPVAGALVECRLSTTGDAGSASTGDDGAFMARAMSGGGTYDCTVSKSDHSQRFELGDASPAMQVAVADGTSAVTGVRIAIRVDHLRLAGKVIDASGAPVPDSHVTASSNAINLATYTDAAGAFGFRDLPATTFVVYVDQGIAMMSDVASGRTDVVLTLPASGRLEGTLVGFATPPLVTLYRRGGGGEQSVTMTAGGFRADGIPVGEYLVSATSRDAIARGIASVVAGQLARVELAAVATGRIEGTLRDAVTREPKVSALCIARSGNHSASGDSDEHGAYSIRDAAAGKNVITCDRDRSEHEVEVIAGKTAHLDIDLREIHIGLVLEDRGKQVFVTSVEPGRIAANAGIQAADRVVKLEGQPAKAPSRYYVGAMESALGYADHSLTLELERGGKTITVTLAP